MGVELTQAAERCGNLLAEAIKDEFALQGHNATYAGYDSLYHTIDYSINKIEITIWGAGYLPYVNSGTEAGSWRPLHH